MSPSNSHPSGALPILAYVYNPRSFATLSLVSAASDVCDLLWIIDTSEPEVTSMERLLRKFGATLDVAGLSIKEAAAEIAKRNPQGILVLADDALRWTAEVATYLGLAFHSPETALRLTDKHAQRAALEAGGLVVPKSWVIAEESVEATFETIEREATFPGVLKPRRGEASRDTLPVNSFEELRTLWEANRSPDGTTREFVLEEYIADSPDPVAGEGFAGYVSVESFVIGGVICHLAVNGRMPPAYPFRETGFFIPSALDDERQQSVLDVAAKAAAAVGVALGCLHTEIKLTPAGPVVIEVNGRIGGGVPEMLEAATGVMFLSLAMRLALGEQVPCDAMPQAQRLAYLFYVQAPVELRTVTTVDGLNDLRAVDGVEEIVLNRGPGRNVDWREGNHGYVFSVFGTASDHDELRRVNELITTLVRIEGDT